MKSLPWSRVPEVLDRLRQSTGVNPEDHSPQPLFMSWDAVHEMAAAGMDIGGHTRNHPVLSRVDDSDVLRREVAGCYDDLQRELGRPPLAFAYPFGLAEHMSDQADAEISRAGFQLSFSFIHGFAPRSAARTYRLPRIHASHGDDHTAFRLRTAIAP